MNAAISEGCGIGRELPDESFGTWFVLRTKSRQEKIIAADLSVAGLGCFLPLVTCTRFYAGRKATVELPLFPGYVFLRGSLDDAYEADRKKRIAQIIQVHAQHELDEELKSLHLALCVNATLNPFPYLRLGVRVVVRSGPLQGLRGKIESFSKRDRLILQVDMLGQATSLEIEPSLLDPLEDAPTTSAPRRSWELGKRHSVLM